MTTKREAIGVSLASIPKNNKQMSRYILYNLILLLCFPFLLMGQASNTTNSNTSNDVLTFTPAHQLKKSRQTRFRKQYFGVLNGKDMELNLVEKKYKDTINLTVTLKDLANRQIFKGSQIVKKRVHQIDSLILTDKEGKEQVIESLFLHNYNPNYINIITANAQVGYFFWGTEPARSDFYPKPFMSLASFKGLYEGRIDGRPAELQIEKRAEGIQVIIEDKEQKQRYWTFVSNLPQGKSIFSIGQLRLKSTTTAKEIFIDKMVLDKDNSQLISGAFEVKGKKVGLFFIRKASKIPNVLPEFSWPPPPASDRLKLKLDTLDGVTQLGDLDTLIANSLTKSGYQFRPNKYFYTPNGFALVSQIEQIDCAGNPLAEVDRWSVNISEFEKDFNLIDYLRSLTKEAEGLYRIFAFVITDDLNPMYRIAPSQEEIEAWIYNGSSNLPEAIANQEISEQHSCKLYVYEFNKKEGDIHAKMVKKGKDKCWKKGEIQLKNINFFDNLNN